MRMMMLAGGASLLGGGAYLAGAFDGGEYYPMAPSAVEARLAGLDFGAEIGMASGDPSIALVLRSRGPKLLRWDLMAGPERLGDVRAHLAPESTGTRVSVDFQFTKGDAMMGLEEDPLLNDIARIAMEEKVDSVLDGRAFDATRLQAKLAAKIAADPGALVNMQTTLHENVANEMERMAPDPNYEYGSGYGSGYGSAPTTATAKPRKGPDFSETHADGGWGNN